MLNEMARTEYVKSLWYLPKMRIMSNRSSLRLRLCQTKERPSMHSRNRFKLFFVEIHLCVPFLRDYYKFVSNTWASICWYRFKSDTWVNFVCYMAFWRVLSQYYCLLSPKRVTSVQLIHWHINLLPLVFLSVCLVPFHNTGVVWFRKKVCTY